MARFQMKKLIFFLFLLTIIPLVSADESFVFTKGENFTIEIPMGNADLSSCATCTCEISIFNPNGSSLVKNAAGTNDGGYCVYTTSIDEIGNYGGEFVFTDGIDYGRGTFEFVISTTGKTFSESQGLGGLGIFAGAIALMFFFMILGFKFTESSKPLALFFVIISIFMAIYSLQLGITYSSGILEWEGLSETQTTVYTLVLYLVGGIGLISFILMSFAFVREFGKGRMMKNYGAGFDPITQTYQ